MFLIAVKSEGACVSLFSYYCSPFVRSGIKQANGWPHTHTHTPSLAYAHRRFVFSLGIKHQITSALNETIGGSHDTLHFLRPYL